MYSCVCIRSFIRCIILSLQTLASYNIIVTIILFIIITVMASLAALLLPIETRGRAMKVNSIVLLATCTVKCVLLLLHFCNMLFEKFLALVASWLYTPQVNVIFLSHAGLGEIIKLNESILTIHLITHRRCTWLYLY